MEWYFYLLIALGAALLALIAVVLIRTLRFRPREVKPYSGEAVSFNKEESIAAIREIINK